jgi:hypothetical protein
LRESWGCDEDAPRVVWESICPKCSGNDEGCVECDGKGYKDHHRCPNSIVRDAPKGTQVHIDLLIRAYMHYDTRNVLPAVGGWLDQTRSFLYCVDLIDSEKAYWESLMDEEMDKQRKRAEMAQKTKGRGR